MNIPANGFQAVPQSDVDFLGTAPIPAKPYYDAEWYELERQAVFMRSWINVGHVSELSKPNDFINRKLEFARTSLLITRGKDGKIRAFHNACTHRGTKLVSEASGQRSRFSCPYHMWTFGQDGALVSAPDFESFGLTKEQCALKGVRVEELAGLIFINFDADALPLRAQLGDFAEEMETLTVARATQFSEYVYEIEANWKIVYDNFQENYHLRFIHPRTGAGGIGPENPFGYPQRYRFHNVHRGQTIWPNPNASASGPVQATGGGAMAAALMGKGLLPTQHGQEYYGLFPNLFVLGNPFQNFSHVVYPLSAGRSRGVVRIYWLDDAENATELFARHVTLTMLRDLHSEDVDVIEDGFQGLSSGALDHIYFQTQEALCRHLFNSVSEQVSQIQRKTGRENF